MSDYWLIFYIIIIIPGNPRPDIRFVLQLTLCGETACVKYGYLPFLAAPRSPRRHEPVAPEGARLMVWISVCLKSGSLCEVLFIRISVSSGSN